MFKEMNKYFSGDYMGFWYFAFVVVLGFMLFGFYNSKSVYQFELTTFDKNGKVIESKVIHERDLGMIETIKDTKAIVPIKKF